ncbi:hypothetical protein NE235_36250 [Actinoallomurus spadix]|uniref:Uncharacterized protein n=1 Tax=Actinoallomurus spadix TaxID=79912 RepID=A0ABN0X410_9ACTN|nr:hypothetical protein [Actinoallomurus spadix]MCO5991581.1 hypothetical protein [Actinoallomurus spadix]
MSAGSIASGHAEPARFDAHGGGGLARAGALFGGDLSPWQGRLLLAAAIAGRPDDPAGALRQVLDLRR